MRLPYLFRALLVLSMVLLASSLGYYARAQNPRPNRPAAASEDGKSNVEDQLSGESAQGFLSYFPPNIYSVIFGKDPKNQRLSPEAPLGVWIKAIEHFSRKRERIDALRDEQNKIFEELSLMRPLSMEDSPFTEVDSRGRIRQLLQAAQENEISLQSVMTDLRKDLQEVVQKARPIRVEIQKLSKEVNRATENMKQGSSADQLRRDARRIFELKRRLSDAEVLLGQVEKNPANGVELLLQELQAFVPRQSARGAMAPILERLDEKLTRLERSQRFLQWRLAADEREIESLKRLLERIHQNQSEMSMEDMQSMETETQDDPAFAPTPEIQLFPNPLP